MPRRAVFHRYPLIGRFAALARREQHLWSFRAGPVRRAIYAGCVLSLLPLMGVQLAVGLVLALIFRANYMVIGLLQFITNPFTTMPIYSGTMILGRRLLRLCGFPMQRTALPEGWQHMGLGEMAHSLGDGLGSRMGQVLISLIIGGIVSGLLLALLLDGVYLLGRRNPAPARPPRDPGAPDTRTD
jgi:uncharacterized protein (DUF2062 family)